MNTDSDTGWTYVPSDGNIIAVGTEPCCCSGTPFLSRFGVKEASNIRDTSFRDSATDDVALRKDVYADALLR